MSASRKAAEAAIRVSLALGCRLAGKINFLRKQYFYPDLPANFQRTSTPFGTGGKLCGIEIKEVHLEEDAGRLDLKTGKVDFGRAGTALIEVVTEPHITSSGEAAAFMESLCELAEYNGICRPARFKVDANISVADVRVEVKNIGSIKGIRTALEAEQRRQELVIAEGKSVLRETRHYDEQTGMTVPAREKETEEDYRKITDADLPEFDISGLVRPAEKAMPEGLFARRERYMKSYGLRREASIAVATTPGIASLFEKLTAKFGPVFAAEWVRSELAGELSYRGLSFESARLDEKTVDGMLGRYAKGEITKLKARQILRNMLDGKPLVKEEEVTGKQLRQSIKVVTGKHTDVVIKLRKGKTGAMDFLVGEVSRVLDFKAHPQKIREELQKRLIAGKIRT